VTSARGGMDQPTTTHEATPATNKLRTPSRRQRQRQRALFVATTTWQLLQAAKQGTIAERLAGWSLSDKRRSLCPPRQLLHEWLRVSIWPVAVDEVPDPTLFAALLSVPDAPLTDVHLWAALALVTAPLGFLQTAGEQGTHTIYALRSSWLTTMLASSSMVAIADRRPADRMAQLLVQCALTRPGKWGHLMCTLLDRWHRYVWCVSRIKQSQPADWFVCA